MGRSWSTTRTTSNARAANPNKPVDITNAVRRIGAGQIRQHTILQKKKRSGPDTPTRNFFKRGTGAIRQLAGRTHHNLRTRTDAPQSSLQPQRHHYIRHRRHRRIFLIHQQLRNGKGQSTWTVSRDTRPERTRPPLLPPRTPQPRPQPEVPPREHRATSDKGRASGQRHCGLTARHERPRERPDHRRTCAAPLAALSEAEPENRDHRRPQTPGRSSPPAKGLKAE